MAAFLTNSRNFLCKNTHKIYILSDKINSTDETTSLKFALIREHSETVQLIVENRQKGAVKFSEPVICVAVYAGELYVGTESGNIYRISERKIIEILRSAKHKDRKQPVKRPSEKEDDDIFGSLLGAKKGGSRTSFEEPIQTLFCDDRYKILNCPGIQEIHAACDILVTLCVTKDLISVNAYKISDIASKKFEAEPMLSKSLFTSTCRTEMPCVLSLVKPFDPGSKDLNCIYLNKVLYNQLFSVDANLLDVPIVVVGLGNGSVYAVPLHGKFKTTLLYQGGGAVVGVHGMKIPESDAMTRDLLELSFGRKDAGLTDSGCTTVALTCVDGNVVFVHGQESSTDPVYVVRYLHGPVACAGASGSVLVVSTLREMYKLTLKMKKDKDGVMTVEQEKSKLGYGQIADLVIHGDAVTSEDLSITAVNTKGNILNISDEGTESPRHHPNRVYGDQMKELLSKITKVSDHLLEESKKSEQLDAVLSQLNLATQVHLEHSMEVHCDKCRQHREKSKTLDLKFEVLHQPQGIFCTYSLELNLENKGNILLQSGWKFAVSLHPANSFCSLKHSYTQSFVLPSIQPGQTHVLFLPLRREAITNLPLVVSTSLLFSPNVPKHATLESNGICDFKPICVTLPDQRLDILNFCSRKNPGDTKTQSCLAPSLAEELRTISDDRPQTLVFSKSQSSQQGGSATCRTKSNWTSSFLVGEKGRCRKCFEQGGVSPECLLLNQLLEWDASENSLANTKLCTPYGHVVSLVVEGATGGKLKVSVQGPNMTIIQELVQALRTRLIQNSDPDGRVKLNRRHMNQALQNYECLRKKLKKLHCDMKEEDSPSRTTIEKFMELHQKLREIDITS